MPKYSTGGAGGNDDGATCELCGRSTDRLQEASIAGAQLSVCQECAPHDDRQAGNAGDGNDRDQDERRRRAARRTAEVVDAQSADPDYWVEEGTDYESDPLPYLVSGYGDRLEAARQEAGLTRDELAEELDVQIQDIEAIEQNRAARAGVGGSVVRALEDHLEITLVEDE